MDVNEEHNENIRDELMVKDDNFDTESSDTKGKVGVTVSIDVTKALLLLGLPSWSSLEPGKEYLLQCYMMHHKKRKIGTA